MPQPAWHLVSAPEEGLPVPCVVKAPDRQGQRGLSLVEDAADLEAAITRPLESRNGHALVEELADGPEVTVNAHSVDGSFHPLTVTDRLADPPAFGVALAHVWPSEANGGDAGRRAGLWRRSESRTGRPRSSGSRGRATGRRGCRPAWRRARRGTRLAALGVDLNALALRAALSEKIEPAALVAEPRAGGASTVFLTVEPGELEAVDGVEEAEAAEASSTSASTGGRDSRSASSGTVPTAWAPVQAVGGSRDEALERARAAAALVRFRTARAGTLA